MKKYILLSAFLLIAVFGHAQNEPYCKTLNDSVMNSKIVRIDSERMWQRTPIYFYDNPNMLVSWYTWKTVCKSDFSTLTGVDNSATVNKYAALNINQTSSTFTFSPIIINPSVTYNKFKWIQSVDFSGTVDKSNVLDLKNWRTVSLSYSVSYIFKQTYTFSSAKRGQPGNKPYYGDYRTLYDELEYRFMQNYIATQKLKSTT